MHAGTFDTQGVQTDSALLALLDAAAASGVRVAVHLEPYAGRDARSVRDDIAYLHATYGRARRGGGGSLTGAHLRVSCRVARAAGVQLRTARRSAPRRVRAHVPVRICAGAPSPLRDTQSVFDARARSLRGQLCI